MFEMLNVLKKIIYVGAVGRWPLCSFIEILSAFRSDWQQRRNFQKYNTYTRAEAVEKEKGGGSPGMAFLSDDAEYLSV